VLTIGGTTKWAWAAAVVLLILGRPAAPAAHEVPNEVTVHAFLRPVGTELFLLVRAPLEAMRDMAVPVRGPGYLDLSRAQPVLRDAAQIWIADYVQVYEGDRRLTRPEVRAVRVSLPSDRSFASYDEAMASLLGPPLAEDTELYWEQGLLDVLFVYPVDSDQSEFAIQPGLTRLGLNVNVVLRFLMPGGVERVFDIHEEHGLVKLDPRWHQAAYRFVREGFYHILDGPDHLLFLLCLVIPFRKVRPLIVIVTSFTIAHSVTLIASAYGMAPDTLWFPPLVEFLIAVSIVYMAFENIAGAKLARRWWVTFGFGLVHGFGFSFLLRDTLQLAGDHVVTSLLAFNVGVEIGQLAVLAVAIPSLELLFRYGVRERMGTILLSALVAHTAWHWAADRYGDLSQFPWPVIDAALLATFIRLLMLSIAAWAVVWFIARLVGRADPTAIPREATRS
jgi:hypothetical protein